MCSTADLAATLAGLGPGDWIRKAGPHGPSPRIVRGASVGDSGRVDRSRHPVLAFPWTRMGRRLNLVMTLGNRTWGMEVKATSTPGRSAGRGMARLAALCGERLRGGNPVLQWSRHPAAGRARHAGGAGERIVDAVVGPTREGRMHRVVLVLILLPTTLPAAAQTTVGVRAGLGSAKMAVPGSGYDAKGEPDSGTISTSYVQSSRSVDGDRERARC